MGVVKEFLLKFTGKDQGASKVAGDVAKGVRAVNAAAKESDKGKTPTDLATRLRALKAEQAAGGNRLIKKLANQDLGEGLGSLIGGAKFGLGTFLVGDIAQKLHGMVDGIKEIGEAWKSGGNKFDIFDQKVMGRLPFGIGEVWSLGRAIHNIFDNTDEKWEAMNKAADEHYEAVKRATEAYNEFKKIVGEVGKATTDRGIGAFGGDSDKAHYDLDNFYQEQKKKLEDAKAKNEAGGIGVNANNSRILDEQLKLDALYRAEQDKIMQEDEQRREDYAQRKQDIIDESNDAVLQVQGKGADAEYEQLVRAGEKKKKELERQAKEDLRQRVATPEEIATGLEKQQRAIDNQTAAKAIALSGRQTREREDHQREVDAQQRSQRIAELEATAGLDVDKRRKLAKEKLDQEYLDRYYKDQQIREDKLATDAQKKRAAGDQQAAGEDYFTRLKNINSGNFAPPPRSGVQATLLDSNFHGLADQFKAGGEPALVEARKTSTNTTTANDHLAKLNRNIEKLVTDGVKVQGIAVRSGR